MDAHVGARSALESIRQLVNSNVDSLLCSGMMLWTCFWLCCDGVRESELLASEEGAFRRLPLLRTKQRRV
jgi:hypothetical protein